ncbi:hypothetical protein A6770_14120 [Nostoc minutum NIES-26]|uniref:Uncharacterized protein n=1 Tax=Nostoc minutum NIES-26 TaxID=1844469 RepID=A0A367RQC9_9NOSO|nr:hypothetical protein A6770_14120 [Nostoc minutum NIES-26]
MFCHCKRSEAIAKTEIATLREGSAYVVPPLYETLRERNDILHLIMSTYLKKNELSSNPLPSCLIPMIEFYLAFKSLSIYLGTI